MEMVLSISPFSTAAETHSSTKQFLIKMDTESSCKDLAGFDIYAFAQSRDDKTVDIVSSRSEAPVTSHSERKHIREFVENLAPYSKSKDIVFRSGKDWFAGFVRPDSPGPKGRLRPILLAARVSGWKAVNAADFADAVCHSVGRLIGSDEMSTPRMDEIRAKTSAVVRRRQRNFGCFPVAFGLVAAGIVAVFRLFS